MNLSHTPKYLKDLFLEIVWNTPKNKLRGSRAIIITSLRITHLIIRDLMEGMITLRAMGLVYTTILALVPLLAVSFSVLKGFGIHNQIEPMLLNFLLPLGDKGAEISTKIIGFVENTKAGVLGSLGFALLLYTVISLIQKIEQSFNYTWRVSHLRSIGKRFSNYLTIVMIGPVLIFSALGITASIANVSLIQDAMQIESIGFLTNIIGHLLPYVLIITAFTFVYMFVPNTKVTFKSALVGAIVSGILWDTSSWAFASFVVGSSNYTAIYSAFASMIIFFIWLYITWLILLIGCSIAFYHQNPAQRNLDSRKIYLSNREKETMALNIMVLIGKHYHAHKPAWTIDLLAQHMKVSTEACLQVIKQLLNKELLIETAAIPTTYIPAYDLDTLSLDKIISAIRCSGETKNHALEFIEIDDNVKQIQKEIDGSIKKLLKQKTLKDLSD
ncbi:MAG: YihY/virulence factor BrkB family protein [Woeseiaceae bacterium]